MYGETVVRSVRVWLPGNRCADLLVTWDIDRHKRSIGNQSGFFLEKSDKKFIRKFLRVYETQNKLPHLI